MRKKRTHCIYCGKKLPENRVRKNACSLRCALKRSIETCPEHLLPQKEKDLENLTICKHCGKEFIKSGVSWGPKHEWKDEYCSATCRDNAKLIYTRTCRYCGKEFKTSYKYAKYCTMSCEEKAKWNQKCEKCGKIFYNPKIVPLCTDCYRDTFAAHCLNCGKVLWVNRKPVLNGENLVKLLKRGYSLRRLKSRFTVDNSKRYCDINCIIEKESPYYYKGIDEEKYPLEFNNALRNQIRIRDKYHCQLCGQVCTEKKLSIHHIDYNKQHNTQDNLISLCASCHAKTNRNRKYWVNYFSNIMLMYGYYD